MVPLAEVARRSRRHNHEENVWVHPFSGRVAGWFTWAFVNLGLTANHVTGAMFVCGVAAAGLLVNDSLPFAVAAFLLFRLHVLLDVSDGEVARYRNQVSRFGVYWDQLIHAFTYPAIVAGLILGRMLHDAGAGVVAFGLLAMIAKSTDLGTKSAYYRVLYSSGDREAPNDPDSVASCGSPVARRLLSPLWHVAGFDGLLFFYALAYLVDGAWLGLLARDWVVAVYAVLLTLTAVGRAALTPHRGQLPMRRDFRP